MALWCFMACLGVRTSIVCPKKTQPFYPLTARSFCHVCNDGPCSFTDSFLSLSINVPCHHTKSYAQPSCFSLWESFLSVEFWVAFFFYVCFFFKTGAVLLCLLGWLPTHDPPASASWVLGFQARTTMRSFSFLPSIPLLMCACVYTYRCTHTGMFVLFHMCTHS